MYFHNKTVSCIYLKNSADEKLTSVQLAFAIFEVLVYSVSSKHHYSMHRIILSFVFLLLATGQIQAKAELTADPFAEPHLSDNSSLWLDYALLPESQRTAWAAELKGYWSPQSGSAILDNAVGELQRGAASLLGRKLPRVESGEAAGAVLLGTLAKVGAHVPDDLMSAVKNLPSDGFAIISTPGDVGGLVITSHSEAGVLYGVFHLLRLMQTSEPSAHLRLLEAPKIEMRMLNHWDNMNGSIERGYAGSSLWKWEELPDVVDSRYEEYARFCASIGINATVLNNVNSNPDFLRTENLEKVAVLAAIFRKWGITTYLSANFSSVLKEREKTRDRSARGGIGDLDTADPLDPRVQAWWRNKAAEIYTLIPDFGGWLVKADSEGMPGPRQYERSHVDGANMLADALAPHGGILLWRTFVYGRADDRAKDVYKEFVGFDGQFKDNVVLQAKNGPIDFQPREPFAPIFGAMPQTDLAIELQIAKEYLGESTTVSYLAPMWEEIFRADTWSQGQGSTVGRVIDGSLSSAGRTCIAGVANTGDDANWCGSIFNQANWYAFGRMAWNHELGSEAIAREWVRQTFKTEHDVTASIVDMMMGSHDATTNYTMPMGQALLCDWGHFKPKPSIRKNYHGGTASGLGMDRSRTGSGFADQYFSPLNNLYSEIDSTPLDLLLWFHHVPWDYQLSSGRSLWEELQFRYNSGVAYVDQMVETWQQKEAAIDPAKYKSVLEQLRAEQEYARLWRETCLNYFASLVEDKEL
ncbi:MAG: alpha-glucuronidase family glycosyl hydrolase [Opitutales bacterium]